MFEKAGKEVYLAPYLHKGHWQLLVIAPDRSLVVLLCSLHKKGNTLSIKNILEASLEAHSRLRGVPSISRKKMQIITPNIFNDSSPMEAIDIEDIRRNWASFILSVSRNLATLK
ncbi:hypothetical protein LR48_Vigan06g088300 [Vigna angularis]|uniref:Ubiquitin-like protease family profile domain-containing protein n=1 Tax=Phaseolus angularis TaxID=3914 RepID=A0A0L9USM7_PHAAN|nr:hypothetical protein LR48_Vigan06g088300 [Vigna angularis]